MTYLYAVCSILIFLSFVQSLINLIFVKRRIIKYQNEMLAQHDKLINDEINEDHKEKLIYGRECVADFILNMPKDITSGQKRIYKKYLRENNGK